MQPGRRTSIADISRAEQFLGYEPKVDSRKIFSRTVAWYRSREPNLQTAAARRDSGFRRPTRLSSSTSRRKFLKTGAAVAAAGGLAVVGDGVIFEANRPQLVSIKMPLSRLAKRRTDFASCK